MSESSGYTSSEEGFHMEVIPKIREDPVEEVAKISFPMRDGYE